MFLTLVSKVNIFSSTILFIFISIVQILNWIYFAFNLIALSENMAGFSIKLLSEKNEKFQRYVIFLLINMTILSVHSLIFFINLNESSHILGNVLLFKIYFLITGLLYKKNTHLESLVNIISIYTSFFEMRY